MKILLKVVKWIFIIVLSFILVFVVFNIVLFSLFKVKNENYFRKIIDNFMVIFYGGVKLLVLENIIWVYDMLINEF